MPRHSIKPCPASAGKQGRHAHRARQQSHPHRLPPRSESRDMPGGLDRHWSPGVKGGPEPVRSPSKGKQGLHRTPLLVTFPVPFSGNRRKTSGHDTQLMSVKIRLKRIGAKNSPIYRVVVADARSPRDGKCIEEVGTYQPRQAGDNNFKLNLERVEYWLGGRPAE